MPSLGRVKRIRYNIIYAYRFSVESRHLYPAGTPESIERIPRSRSLNLLAGELVGKLYDPNRDNILLSIDFIRNASSSKARYGNTNRTI